MPLAPGPGPGAQSGHRGSPGHRRTQGRSQGETRETLASPSSRRQHSGRPAPRSAVSSGPPSPLPLPLLPPPSERPYLLDPEPAESRTHEVDHHRHHRSQRPAARASGSGRGSSATVRFHLYPDLVPGAEEVTALTRHKLVHFFSRFGSIREAHLNAELNEAFVTFHSPGMPGFACR